MPGDSGSNDFTLMEIRTGCSRSDCQLDYTIRPSFYSLRFDLHSTAKELVRSDKYFDN